MLLGLVKSLNLISDMATLLTRSKYLLILIVILLSAHAGVSQVFSIQSIDKSMQVSEYLTYQIDSTNKDLEAILLGEFTRQVPAQYYANEKVAFWTKLIVTNKTNSDQFVITIDQWNEAMLFMESDSGWTKSMSGTNHPVHKRPLSLHRLLSFPVVV